MRTMPLKDFVLEEFNRMLAEEGRGVQIVTERARPKLATDGGRLVGLWAEKNGTGERER
jgi:hypothetical protein